MRGRGGFSLAEVVVGAVLLGLGLTAVAGTVRIAAVLLARAARKEDALLVAEAVTDSLASVEGRSGGERWVEDLLVRWRPEGEGEVVLLVLTATGTGDTLLELRFIPEGGEGDGAR